MHVMVEAYDYRKSGRHVLLGAARLSAQDVMDRATSQVLDSFY
jgi:hypothetical protein